MKYAENSCHILHQVVCCWHFKKPTQNRGALSWVIFSTSSNISLCYMLDGGAEPEHTWTCSVLDLYHHVQQFYSTMLSHTANCCGRYKLIWTVSCISHNISHHLSSPPFNVKLSVWLPSSCNAAPLITKPTTQHKQVAVRLPITQYHIMCCYPVSRPGLLDVQWLGEFVRGDWEMVGAVGKLVDELSTSHPFTFCGLLIICRVKCK